MHSTHTLSTLHYTTMCTRIHTHTQQQEIIEYGNKVIQQLSESITETAAEQGDVSALLKSSKARIAINAAVSYLEKV
jgi:hypothetical protein